MGISFNAASLLNGSGIDIQSVVNAILRPQTGQLTAWQNQQTDFATQAGLLAGINNNLTSLQNAINALGDFNGPLASLTADSSQPNIVTALAQSSAIPGTHQIVVSSLATVGTIYTAALADGDTSFLTPGNTTGDIQLQIGGAGPSGTLHDIPITQGSNDTLNTLASYINGQGWGVTATVVNDSSGARLAIYSQASGRPGALAVVANSNTALSFQPPVGGTNASLTVDGVPFDSSTNTVTGAIPGVTLTLNSTAPGTQVQIVVTPDATQAAAAITNFVTAYNAVIGNLNTQFAVDPTTHTQGPLGSDSSLRSLQSNLLNDVTYSVTGNGGLVNLASLGINLNSDGTLTIDNTQLNSTFTSNPAAFQTFFQNASSSGFANNFSSDLRRLTDPANGVVALDLAENQTQQQSLTSQITSLQDRLSNQKNALTAQYAQVNATLESYPLLLQEINAELGALGGNFSAGTPSNVNSTPTTGTPTG
jgi:flagellar hook-associated protein 2